MKKKLLAFGLTIVLLLLLALPVWAAVTFSITSWSCSPFLYYDSNNVRKIFSQGTTIVNSQVDYIDINGIISQNGIIISSFGNSSTTLTISASSPSFTYNSSSYYDTHGSHYGQKYIWYWIGNKYDTESKTSSGGIH